MLNNEPITITDPTMTRFMMFPDEAVDLVLFAFRNANPGDLFVQKAPGATVDNIAKAIAEICGSKNHPIKNID